MARKKKASAPDFYESLTLTGQANNFVPSLPAEMPQPLPWEKLGEQLWDDAIALGRDSGRALRGAWRRLVNKRARRIWLALIVAGGVISLSAALVIGATTMSLYANDISSPSSLLNKKKVGTTILDRNGEALFQVYGANNRKLAELEDLPPYLVKATLAAEDARFFDHSGFSWRDTARAVYQDIANRGIVQGGSTITQQLVKNTLLTSERSFQRKFQELVLAMQVEQRYEKSDIMEMYLNAVYYGQGSYGIESAAQTYFHKPANDLTLGESALLAGLPLGPSRFDPNVDLEAAGERRSHILARMRDLKFITPAQAKAALAEPIPANAHQITIRAPHFVFYVLEQLREQYGEEAVEHGGITVYTTLDLRLQNIAEEQVRSHVASLAGNHVTNGGLVAINPTNGELLAMVGSVDFNEGSFGKVNVTLAELQPGSSFKPFVYATAFQKGWNGATVLEDKPLSIPQPGQEPYKPLNYDGKFRGRVTLRRALANSLNIPAIETIRFTGLDDVITTARNMGITTLGDSSQYGVALALGAAEVRPIDMASAFGVFANGGRKLPVDNISKVLDRNGRDITKVDKTEPGQVLDPRIAYMITNILSDNAARTELFGANSPLKLSHPAAVKTGTTNDFRDNWTVGYTPNLVAAVWVGNNDHSQMFHVSGITGAAPIWRAFMEAALAGTPVTEFARPDGLASARVCMKDGGLANPWDRSIEEIFLAENVPTRRCSSEAPKPKEEEKPAEPTPATEPPKPEENNGQGNGQSD